MFRNFKLIQTIFFVIFSVSVCLADQYKNYSFIVTYVDSLISQWGSKNVAASIGVPGYPQNPTPYNVFNLAFEVSYGFADAAAVWMNPKQYMDYSDTNFGSTNSEIQKSWRRIYNQNGVKIMLSAFGATWNPTDRDPVDVCSRMAYTVKDNNLDGIDLDYEDNEAMNKGRAEEWLIKCTKTIRQILPKGDYLLTHAPQAPYFVGYKVYPNGAYEKIHKEVGDMIDWYNVQFYNQGNTTYDTYELLFIDAKYGEWNGTAVKQIHENAAVPYEKIVIGKPCLPKDASNTGYVLQQDLHNWGLRAQKELGWNAGFMTWQYRSDEQDLKGTYMSTVVGDLAGPFPTQLQKVN